MKSTALLAWAALLLSAPARGALPRPDPVAPPQARHGASAESSEEPPQGSPRSTVPPLDAQDTAGDERYWIDPQDGWFDASSFLASSAGFLPVVVPITEPALGYGALGGAAFLQPRESAGAEGWARPNITFVGGMWTEGGSEGGFVLDSRRWGDGGIQSLFGGAALSLDLDYYGDGADSNLQDDPLEYLLDVWGLVGIGRARLDDSDFWGGLRFTYAEAEVRFRDAPADIPGVSGRDRESTLAGPTLELRYDSLDNGFTPTSGTLADVTGAFYDDAFGGDRDFQLLTLALIHHGPLGERWFLGGRAQLGAAFGDTPFYMRPYVQQRGIPALRYQGDQALSGELELRWQFHPRFSVLGFGGGGSAWSNDAAGEHEQSAFAGGGGMRYLLARRFGLHAGLDIAYGPEDGVVYVQFGNAWPRL